MADLVVPILEVIIKFICRPAKKYLNYHRKFNEYVDALKQAQTDLHNRKADIELKLQGENRFGTKPKQEVERWFKKVEEKISHAQVVEENVCKVTYLFRSCVGKLADKTVQEIKKVHDEGHFPDGLVVNDPLATKLELPTEELVGSNTTAEEIYKYLMGDVVRKIGVWGMGGVGKTTIVKNVYNKLLGEAKFGILIWTTVSQDFNIRRIQNDIASQLKENLSEREDTTVRAAKLSEIMKKQGSYVLFLDDVWTRFLLSDVGIPDPEAEDGCKLILTTRREDVIRSMDCKQVQVKCLAEHEALQLFFSKLKLNLLVADPLIELNMKLIVKECSGLPLAIVTVAGSMKGNYDPIMWENALIELKDHICSIQLSEDKVFGCLKFSYFHLEPKLRPCFLYCALYPEDYKIAKVEIIEHWLEEGLVDQMETRKAMHKRGHVFLRSLEECCLLERVEDGYHIKMHDLVRDMALRITEESPRFFVKAGLQLTELSDEQLKEDLEKVSFMRSGIKTIPSNLFSSRCLKLTTLFLSNNHLRIIPDTFFDYMPNLKIMDLSKNHKIESLPHSLSNLVNLTTLLLSSCRNLRIVPSLGKLVALRKLDMEETRITEIPQGLEALLNLRYLNLGYTRSLEKIPSGIFVKLVHLQHLVLYPASLREEELRASKKLEFFDGNTDIHGLRMYVSSKKLPNEYFINVGQLDYSGFSRSFRRAKGPFYSQVDNNKGIAFVDVDINAKDLISVPSDIQQFVLDKCRKVRSADDIGGLKGATNLKECVVMGCNDLEYLFSSWCTPLKTLESVYLNELRKLKNLVKNSGLPPCGNFSSLKTISLCHSHGIKKLFSATSILGDLCNLEVLDIMGCGGMEEIIASKEEEEEEEFVLPKLKRFFLSDLPNLRSICNRNVVMECDSLEYIEIRCCGKLERIPLYFSSLDSTQPSIPPSLKEFDISPSGKEWWERVEWDVHPNVNVKNVFQPIIKF